MIPVVFMLAVVGFVLSFPAVWLLIKIGERLNKVDMPDAPGGRKDHARPIVNIGGIGIVWAILLPMVCALAGAWVLPEPGADSPALYKTLHVHFEGLRSQTVPGMWLLAGVLAIHVLGLLDDRLRLSAFPKLAVQLAVALALVLGAGFRVLEFLDQFGVIGFALSVAVTVVWIVVLTNAMNFLDNMDGLSSGVGIICAAMLCGSAVVSGQWFVAGLAALLLGALTGFLFHNFPSARIYMGDGGSLVLGLLLSVLAVRLTYVPMPAEGGIQVGSLALITPLVVLAVPLYDFVSVCGIRLLQGRSPFVGDQQHFSHRLVKMGLSRRSAVLVVWACTLATGLSGLMLPSLALWQGMLAFLQTLAILAVLAILEITHRKNSV